METTTLAQTNDNIFMFDLHSAFRSKTTAKCHNTIALKKDYKTFSKRLEETIDYLSGIEVMHSIPDHVSDNLKLFLEHTDTFIEILSTSICGILDSEREDIEAKLRSKLRDHFNAEKKRALVSALNKDEVVIDAIFSSFNQIIESFNEYMDNIECLMEADKITKPILNDIICEIKNIASLSYGYHSMLYNLVTSMSKYKMDYKDGNLVLCFTGKKKDIITIENV